ncbi:hypothetical protein HBNXHr_2643 [Halorhabdus sp. BNX81]|nr:hypothetical protein HBNXHr_2643 [Halorhabdus sp. BNX81]
MDREAAEEKLQEVVSVVTSEAYLDQLEKVRQAPPEERMEAGARYLTPSALREAGVEVPEDMRISSRLFDDQIGKETEFGNPDADQPNVISDLSELDPEYLSRLRDVDPDLFEDIIDEQHVGFGSENPLAACACAGGFGVCAGAGW